MPERAGDERITHTANVTWFHGPWLPTLLRRAGDWLDDHYYDGHPQAVLVEASADSTLDHGTRWSVGVVQDA